jgi:hypothetical protein
MLEVTVSHNHGEYRFIRVPHATGTQDVQNNLLGRIRQEIPALRLPQPELALRQDEKSPWSS